MDKKQKQTKKSEPVSDSDITENDILDDGSSEEEESKSLQKLKPKLPKTVEAK